MESMKKTYAVIQIPRRFVLDEWGGSETFIAETSSRLNERGFLSRIYTTKALCSTTKETYRNIPVQRFPYFYPYLGLSKEAVLQMDKKAGNLFSFSLMRALKKDKTVEIIHLHTGKRLGGIGRKIALKKGIPYVISLHGGNMTVPKDEMETWTEPTKGAFEWGKILGMLVGSRRVLDDASAIICVGKDEYEVMSKRFPDKIVEYLPNGVDIARFTHGDGVAFRKKYHIPEDRFLCLTTARIDPQKNQLGLVRVLPRLVKAIPQIHLLFVGNITNAEYYAQVTEEAEKNGTSEHITIIPGIPYASEDLPGAYHAADCFVLPSLHEPFGMVLLEAWASGLPVAASDRGGIPYIITAGENGLLFNPEATQIESTPVAGLSDADKEKACRNPGMSMAQAIELLATQKELRNSYGAKGKEKAIQEYSWDTITDRLINVYRRVYEYTLHK